MQVTKELIDKDIAGLTAQIQQLVQQIEQQKLAVAQLNGALATLHNIQEFLDRPEPEVVATTEISPENQAIQDRDQARALSMTEVAELVAGPGAEAELVQAAEEESLDANK